MTVTSLERLEAALAAAPTVRVRREQVELSIFDPNSLPERRKFARPRVRVTALLVTIEPPSDVPVGRYADRWQALFLEDGRLVSCHWTYTGAPSADTVARESQQTPSKPFGWRAAYHPLRDLLEFVQQYTGSALATE